MENAGTDIIAFLTMAVRNGVMAVLSLSYAHTSCLDFFFFFLISLPKCLEGWDGDVSGEITPVFTWILCFWYGLHRRCFKQHMESMHRRINVCWCWCSQKEIDSNGFRTLLKQGFWHFLDSFFTAEILLKYGLSLFCWKTYRR